jgi:DIS3-like exonuclease 1
MVHRQLLAAVQKPPASAVMNDLELSELCHHLNRKHRSSKQAQRDSTELFEALYFKGMLVLINNLHLDKNETQDAIIYNIKANGCIVFIPKYGMRGSIYLRDKFGNLLIPPNALSLSPGMYTSNVAVNDYTFEDDTQRIVLQTSKGPLYVELFDHLNVKIVVQESRAHRPPIRLMLNHFGQEYTSTKDLSPSTSQSRVTTRDMEKTIKEEEAVKKVITFLCCL